MTKDALLEIGSEELPASFIKPGMEQLKALAEASLKAGGLSFASIEVYGTPRRLAVVIRGLPDHSPDQKKSVMGPVESVAKDAQGQWTAAAFGFARKQGLKPSDLTIENGRIKAVLDIPGVATRRLLGDLFSQWISKLEFPKSMEWEPSHFRYPRPLRWLAALFGSDLVSMNLAGVRSARWTLGLGPSAPKRIAIPQAGKYEPLLKDQCVLVDPEERREAIRRYAEQAAKRVHGKVPMSAELLEQVANLVEHPVAILGNFDPSYLDLPKEVLITCLEHHQKFFPVTPHPAPSPLRHDGSADAPKTQWRGGEGKGEGELLPHFIGIRNGMSVHQEIVREGYERVLAARLADARFFFDQDRRVSLAPRAEALKGIIFQEKLGTLYDKVQRMKVLIIQIANLIPGSDVLRTNAGTAADLCKTDLTTAMVGEFPELQGKMGRIYGEMVGLDPAVSRALEEHYWPITLAGNLPTTDAGALLALADKLDTLAGDFAVGLIPSGSADPYGLRRAAVGVLRILESKTWPLPLEWLIEQSVEAQPSHVKHDPAQTRNKLNQFMQQRFAAMLIERGVKADEIEAVLVTGIGVVKVANAKIQALHNIRKLPEFEALASSFKRAANIVRQASEKNIDLNGGVPEIALFKEPCERELWESLISVQSRLQDNLGYEDILKNMVPLREPLARFFEGVMVMAEDHALRKNRLKLLEQITILFQHVADFSKLQNV